MMVFVTLKKCVHERTITCKSLLAISLDSHLLSLNSPYD